MYRVLASLALLASSPSLVSAWAQPNHPLNPPPAPFFENVTIWAPPALGLVTREATAAPSCSTRTASKAYRPSWRPLHLPEHGLRTIVDHDLQAHFDGNSSLSGGVILQPFLYELSEAYGKYPAGTVMLAGNRIPGDSSSTNIQMYASRDKGYTWEYVSTIVASGPPNTNNGAPCVWEPFILSYASQLAVYFSDQSDPRYGQKLSHRLSTSTSNLQPGLPRSTTSPTPTHLASRHDHYRANRQRAMDVLIRNGPLARLHRTIRHALSHRRLAIRVPLCTGVRTEDRHGRRVERGPYTVWTPAGGPHGTIVVSDSSYDQLFLNTQNGDPRAWRNVTSGHGVGYTRALTVFARERGKAGAGVNGGMYAGNFTEITVGDFVVPGPEAGSGGISGL
ncbi:hypothetical protein B0H13DRAFT_1885313 [Mycena leptocephala]|nr:hypothetical protein B0H13DRAFT_1885313 [Mycena leptocephala]